MDRFYANNRVRLTLAVYNSLQNALILQRQSPFRYRQSSSRFHPLMAAWSLCWVVFAALSNILSCSFSEITGRDSSHFTCCFSATVSLPRCPVYVFSMHFMCLCWHVCHNSPSFIVGKSCNFLFTLSFSWPLFGEGEGLSEQRSYLLTIYKLVS